MRTEQEVFLDISNLCRSPGYIHAIVYFCHRENTVMYDRMLKAEDIHYRAPAIVRTEISTLIGLLIKEEIDHALPAPRVLQEYIDQTEVLLREIHEILASTFLSAAEEYLTADSNPLGRGTVLREAIFYSCESAYDFQYRELAVRKYRLDDQWLIRNKGFSITSAKEVVKSLKIIQEKKIALTLRGMKNIPPDSWTILPGYEFDVMDIVSATGITKSEIEAVLSAFTVPIGEKNAGFNNLGDFNLVSATPILRKSNDIYILPQPYCLAEALYESPFYWMNTDKSYGAIAAENRGRFTEAFAHERLALVFGKNRVTPNVEISNSKGNKQGEIDVLVVFGDRAIIVQAKSKRLTLPARKGNDGQIQGDFQKSVRDSYEQGLKCSELLLSGNCKLSDAEGNSVAVSAVLKHIYIFCVISDHYPSLSFQVRQFLQTKPSQVVRPPLVADVFALDALTEMLQSPIKFLSYIDRRVSYSERLSASHESIILSYHIKYNLWLDDENTHYHLADDIADNLDVAMMVRRDGIEGKPTPDGALTQFDSSTLGQIAREIEANPDPIAIELGLLFLSMSGDAVKNASNGINKISQLARKDGLNHNMTFEIEPGNAGFTIHCNDDPEFLSVARLEHHCALRKYTQKAGKWFGICLSSSGSLRFVKCLDYKWNQDFKLDGIEWKSGYLSHADSPRKTSTLKKTGRNDLCPCGSGLKYKKCCLRR